MDEPAATEYPDLLDDQMLAIGIYGETVAAYRYTVLSEKVPAPQDKQAFAAIADEEQSHKQRLQHLLQKHFPDSSFYLSDEDKALVVAGPRLIDVRDISDYREVVRMTLDTEWRVARFYRVMSDRVRHPEVRAAFRALADEGADHHRRLTQLARERGFLPPEADT